MNRRSWSLALLLVGGGCGLVNSNLFRYDYPFAAQPFTVALTPSTSGANGSTSPGNGGGGGSAGSPPVVGSADGGVAVTATVVPDLSCDPSASSDVCATVPAPNVDSPVQLVCDAATSKCVARAEVSLASMVDLSMQPLPADVVQYSVEGVSIKKVAYWLQDHVDVAVPSIDLYVAPAAATRWDDPEATLLGSMAALPPNAAACADSVDSAGDAAAGDAVVCDLKLQDSGKTALASYVKSYNTPFQLIAHTVVTAKAGETWPSGSIDYWVRPTVSFSVVK